MRPTKIVADQTAFQVEDAESIIIGSSSSGYTLYFGPASDDLQPYKDADGNNVEVAANHPITVICAKGTWFKLSGNSGNVKVNY